jgi:23S rRNA (uracil1939-C5)-methyltransferase
MPSLNGFIAAAAAALREGQFSGADTIRAIASPTTGEVASTFLRGRERAPWTSGAVTTEVSGIRYRLRPFGFFQPNRYLLAPLLARVAELSGDARTILDLFSGDGFFSLPLARHAGRVIAVDRRSTANALRNAELNRIGNVTFVKASARAFLLKTDVRPETIVLDPTRSGTGADLARRVAGLGAARIVYVSCNPTTFAPDAAALRRHGYRMTSVELLDQFPNTHHIETVALFEI